MVQRASSVKKSSAASESAALPPQLPSNGLPSDGLLSDSLPLDDLPPAYAVIDPNADAGPSALPVPIPATPGDLKIEQKKPKELTATRAFGCDRALHIHTTNVSSSSLLVEHDTDQSNTNSVVVIAEVWSPTADIKERCTVTTDVNARGEYDVCVAFKLSAWTLFGTKCRFTVRVPASAKFAHPGLRAELCNGSVKLDHVHNVDFAAVDVQTSSADVTLSDVSGQRLRIGTSNGTVTLSHVNAGSISVDASNSAVKASHVQARESLRLTTKNRLVELVGSRSPIVSVATTNAGIALERVTGDEVDASTTNAKLECREVAAGDLRLKTSNHTIDTSAVAADALTLVTSNASITGSWTVRHRLSARTSNSRIVGAVQLKDPLARASIELATTNARVEAVLPAAAFCGTFDAKTSNSSVGIEWADAAQGKEPLLKYTVDSKSHKRGSVGASSELRHDLVASTSNSAVSIRFVAD
ncbi:hypothetical protein IWW55_001538 [Coemansia sp. RSA 2706]|nr:hypothetical protein IWW55_001538 [Coemansia sp. RSA 2706]